jgi:hypothetical protein
MSVPEQASGRTQAIIDSCKEMMKKFQIGPSRLRDDLALHYLHSENNLSLPSLIRCMNGEAHPRAEIILAIQEWTADQQSKTKSVKPKK